MSKSKQYVNIGISEQDRKNISDGLSKFLADSFVLYLKTHNYHWNVTGPMFQTLHTLFMTQYTEQWNALDVVAERIRALDHIAPGSFYEFSKLTSIKENTTNKKPNAQQMIQELTKAQETAIRTAREVLKIAENASDQPTVDLLSSRMDVHEKNAWMLRSILEE